ncbi:hypothetical protein JTB14_002281 [Gonioctena quinquepunctata]|nr:hypothetical protein JTB14_002281 [Gonioctena quinquepunctata]
MNFFIYHYLLSSPSIGFVSTTSIQCKLISVIPKTSVLQQVSSRNLWPPVPTLENGYFMAFGNSQPYKIQRPTGPPTKISYQLKVKDKPKDEMVVSEKRASVTRKSIVMTRISRFNVDR